MRQSTIGIAAGIGTAGLGAARLVAALALWAGPQAGPVRLALTPDAEIALAAAWEPCRSSKYGLFEETAVLRSPAPAEATRRYGAAELAPLLPKEPVRVGDTWAVPADAALAFLRQLHPSARSRLHHGFGSAPGAYGCLRAASAERAEVWLRVHAEFELEGGVTYTPAQFEGRLVLERASGRPLALRLALPDRDTNVDVNVPVGDGGSFHADIGHVPRLELAGGDAGASGPQHAWTSSVPELEARARLARRFYAFARLDWLPFDEAVRAARELERPLHVIVLFGTLDDESC